MISIAIDGPAGAGKSTIAKAVAKEIGYIYVDTGALYRTIGLYVLSKGKSTELKEEIISCLPEIKICLEFKDNTQRVLLCGEDVTDKIRTPEVSMAASAVSSVKEVRDFLFDLQRDIAENNNILMDGRDIGTVVLPNAKVKIFLTASAEARAKRRYDELVLKGYKVNYDEVLGDIKKRDYNDENRAIAPLKPASDATVIDTTDKNLQESIDYLKKFIEERI